MADGCCSEAGSDGFETDDLHQTIVLFDYARTTSLITQPSRFLLTLIGNLVRPLTRRTALA